jgi:hypothetical protein
VSATEFVVFLLRVFVVFSAPRLRLAALSSGCSYSVLLLSLFASQPTNPQVLWSL